METIKTLTQVVDCVIITKHGRGWQIPANRKGLLYSFSLGGEKLITSRDDHAEWSFYLIWDNGRPGPRYACKVEQGQLVEVPFEKWDPQGGFRQNEYSAIGGGHNIIAPLSKEEFEMATRERNPFVANPPSHASIMVQLLTELAAK